jgi:flagellar hook-associated protein 2
VAVSVVASDTLQDIAGKINGASGIGVLASVVDNRLILKSRTTGTSGAINIDADPDGVLSSLGVVNPGTTTPKNVLQAAQDAVLTVDGLTVTRSSNTVTDVIPGVTLELRAVTSSPVTVTVSRNIAPARDKIKAWVDKYNAAFDVMARLEAGSLKGDPLLARIKLSLRSRIAREVGGLSPYRNLYQIGISTGGTWQGGTLEEAKAGRLRVDESKLTSALEADPRAVKELFFAADPAVTGIGEALEADLGLWLDTGGLLPSRDSTISAQEKRIDDQIAAWQRILDHREKVLLRQFTASEQVLLFLQQQGQYLQQRLNLLLSGSGV